MGGSYPFGNPKRMDFRHRIFRSTRQVSWSTLSCHDPWLRLSVPSRRHYLNKSGSLCPLTRRERPVRFKYLSRYLYRGVNGETNIDSNQNGKVTFKYDDPFCYGKGENTGETIRAMLPGVSRKGAKTANKSGFTFRRSRETSSPSRTSAQRVVENGAARVELPVEQVPEDGTITRAGEGSPARGLERGFQAFLRMISTGIETIIFSSPHPAAPGAAPCPRVRPARIRGIRSGAAVCSRPYVLCRIRAFLLR